MTISLNDKVIAKSRLTLGEVLLLIAVQNNVDFEESEKTLVSKGYISIKYSKQQELFVKDGFFITNKGKDALNTIVLDSDKVVGTEDFITRIEQLVPQLQSIYPDGKNFNNQYWKGNKTDIKKKLQTFFKKYGNEYTDEQLITATRAYVAGFNGDYKFMRLLKYFIWKEEVKDGTRVPVSELADYIENAGQENDLTNDWTSSLN